MSSTDQSGNTGGDEWGDLQDVFASMEYAVRERDSTTSTEIDMRAPDSAAGWATLISITAPPAASSSMLREGSQTGRWRISQAVSVTCTLPTRPPTTAGLTRRQRLTFSEASSRVQRAADRGLVEGRTYTVLGGCLLPGRGSGPARKLLMLRDPTCDGRSVGRAALSHAAWRGSWSHSDKRWTKELRTAAAWPLDGTPAARGVFYMALSDFADTFETCTISSTAGSRR
jgi:hypothetical protein